jgi:hypothetical protein
MPLTAKTKLDTTSLAYKKQKMRVWFQASGDEGEAAI